MTDTEKPGQDVDLHCSALFTFTLSSDGTSRGEICIFKGLWRHALARVIVRATVSHTADPEATAGASAALRGLWEKPGCWRENATDVTLWARETRRRHQRSFCQRPSAALRSLQTVGRDKVPHRDELCAPGTKLMTSSLRGS